MIDNLALLRLQSWLSPALPTGAFSYSHGLEQAVNDKLVETAEDLKSWLLALLKQGTGWNDALLLQESWKLTRDNKALFELEDLAKALCFSKERYLETTAQGEAFYKAAKAWGAPASLSASPPLPVAVGALASHHDIASEAALTAFLNAFLSNQIQAALRLMKLGQQEGVILLAGFENDILEVAQKAAKSSLDDLGSASFMADIAAMRHETLQSRIFRS